MALSIETLALAKKFSKTYTDTAISQLPNGIVYRGAVDYYSDLPNNAEEGDAYTVKYTGTSGTTPDGTEYVWGNDGGTLAWIAIGPDPSQYRSNRAFPEGWPTTNATTTKAFCDVVNADATAIQGMSYLGEVRWSDLPSTLVNAEVVVEIMSGTGTSGKVIHLVLTSGNLYPYRWEYTYWNNGTKLSGWIAFQPELSTISVTYDELVAKINNHALQSGMFYRITDYVTKINGTYDISSLAGSAAYVHYAKSAEHPFDIIVQALDESTLSENASAIQHAGDTYFANSSLTVWQLKYAVENNPLLYAWADTTNGKGVIYYMKDEFGNECHYDFKNIQYLAYAITYTDAQYNDDLCYDASTQPNRYGSVYYVFQALSHYLQTGTYTSPFPATWHKDFSVGANILGTIQFPAADATYLSAFNADWYYTFDEYNTSTGEHQDKTLNSSGLVVTYDNVIGRAPDALSTTLSLQNIPEGLPVNIFEYLTGVSDEWCWDNKFGDNSLLNIFSNMVGTRTDTGFAFNITSPLCNYNIFGNSCNSNSFGNDCNSNSFGNDCNSNSFGNSCNYNSFGNSCNSNSFGNYCNYNSFGNSCNSNSFGNYCYSNTVSENVHYIEMVNNTSPETTIGRYTILSGQYGTSPSNKYQLTISTSLPTYPMYVGIDINYNIKIWNPIDLVP